MSRTVTCGVCGWSRTRSRWLPGWTGRQAQIIRAEHVTEVHSFGAPLDSERYELTRPTLGPSTPSGASTANESLRPTVPSGFDDYPREERAFAPHCDQRILHAPGECWACDLYPDWQALRVLWGIAFTGQAPLTGVASNQLPCPADFNRPPDSRSDHRQWGPNRAQGARRG